MTSKLSSKLPDVGPSNGLYPAERPAINDPHGYHVYVTARLVVAQVTDDIDLGRKVPTFRIDRIEPVDSDVATRLLDEAYRDRGLRAELPFEDGADDDA